MPERGLSMSCAIDIYLACSFGVVMGYAVAAIISGTRGCPDCGKR